MRRLLCISDIHGHAGPLARLLDLAEADPGRDQLVFLGDYVARGPDSHGVIQIVRRWVNSGAVALRGNHDDHFGRTWARGYPRPRLLLAHLKWGGAAIYRSYLSHAVELPADVRYLLGLPVLRRLDGYLFVHAGLRPGRPLAEQTERDLMSIRTPWLGAANIPTTLKVIFGHTPTWRIRSLLDLDTDKSAVLVLPGGRLGIDTGAGEGRRLSLVDLTNCRVYWEDITKKTLGLAEFDWQAICR